MEMHTDSSRTSRDSHLVSSPTRRFGVAVRLAPLALLACALLAAPAIALAASAPQATLTGETPGINANVTAKDATSVKLTFSTTLSSSGSDITVTDNKGNGVSSGPLVVKGDTMTVNMKGDGNGTYLVVWHAIGSAKDSVPTTGAYTFWIGSSTNPSGEVGSTSELASTLNTGAPTWVVIVVGVAGLIIGFAASRLMGGGAMPARPAPSARPAPPARQARSSATTEES